MCANACSIGIHRRPYVTLNAVIKWSNQFYHICEPRRALAMPSLSKCDAMVAHYCRCGTASVSISMVAIGLLIAFGTMSFATRRRTHFSFKYFSRIDRIEFHAKAMTNVCDAWMQHESTGESGWMCECARIWQYEGGAGHFSVLAKCYVISFSI